MTSPKNRTILSASSVKQFIDCSWFFYQTRFEKVPDLTHPKTHLGSLAHTVLECLKNPRHHKHYSAIRHEGSVYASAPVARLIKMYVARNPGMTPEILADLDKVVFVALNHNFFHLDAKRSLEPEHPFQIDFGDFEIRGYMDDVAIYDNLAVITDFKSQSKKFTAEQLEFNIQSYFYQLAVKHEFGLPARVEFILLRFPPTKKDAMRHVQTVEPLLDEHLEGFKFYLAHINRQINDLTAQSAKLNLKATSDPGFCKFVCSLRQPFDFWSLCNSAGKIVRSVRIPRHLPEDLDDFGKMEHVLKELRPGPGERVVPRRYVGCPHFYPNAY